LQAERFEEAAGSTWNRVN